MYAEILKRKFLLKNVKIKVADNKIYNLQCGNDADLITKHVENMKELLNIKS